MDTPKNYVCVNCGSPIASLYKRYESSVLKLTECEKCGELADKYVEYDVVIIFIDIVLLRIIAYRHILLNSTFKSFWKLWLLSVLLESYSNWMLLDKNIGTTLNVTEPYLSEMDIYLDDFKFYKMFMTVTLSFVIFILLVYSFTRIYTYFNKQSTISLMLVWKTVTFSSCGLFLMLPSLIWNLNMHQIHIYFITLYTTLSQLLAYKALCNCSKPWSIIVIFSSYLIRIFTFNQISSNVF